MRFMIIVKATGDSEAGVMPGEDLMAEMAKYHQELQQAGVLLDGSGLHPSRKGWRITYNGQARTVTDGPFTETKELVAGYWIWEVRDMDEAVAWVKRCPNPMLGKSEIEIRPVFEMSDFAEVMTPEAEAVHNRVREKEERRQ